MAVSFQQALAPVRFLLSAGQYYTADIGEPPAGAQMLLLFGTNAERNQKYPNQDGHTYGGLPIPWVADGSNPQQYNGKTFLLESFAGKSGTTLSIQGNGHWDAYDAVWVLSDGTVEHVEFKTHSQYNGTANITHDPTGYSAYGTCGLYYNIGAFTSFRTLGGTRTPVQLGTRDSFDMGANTRMYHMTAALSEAADPGTFTHTYGSGMTIIMSMMFGEVGGGGKRLQQSIVIT